MLSDELTDEAFFTALTRLNAPFGAWCFVTAQACAVQGLHQGVLMHLLVPGAFGLRYIQQRDQQHHVLMHLLALGAI